ncbi:MULTISPECIES: phage Gp37/Gp68 family protein [unclassified Rhodanobacter]|uniref:phage Gp37/Gp68 family protein n=1 Tax=unclassified Rhodanobacter TaxID=2621553 RepID=UPI0007AA0503|nr:phage Gp37/Gp68 family protein [Rhodanobacter sp. FW510-R10]KZC32630.1 hypothetical protein RhoFW510R10_12000 [Rhodanobacter sp. FW510-R10]
MADRTKIEWCDSTWNPWIGCTKISPACDFCYAAVSAPARALGVEWGSGRSRRRTSASNWHLPLRWNAQPYVLCETHGWRGERRELRFGCSCPHGGSDDSCVVSAARRRVFCASLADVFDNEVDPQWRSDLLDVIDATPNIDWLLLTKRIGNVTRMLTDLRDSEARSRSWSRLDAWITDRDPWPNVWIGATICNQAEADRDIPKLLETPAAMRFLSMEPLLGAVDVRRWMGEAVGGSTHRLSGENFDRCDLTGAPLEGIDWVIVGGESGARARPIHPDWARNLRDQCAGAAVPFLFKQWGEWRTARDVGEASSYPCLVSNRAKLPPGHPARDTTVMSGCFHLPHQVQSTIDGVGKHAHLDCAMFRAGKRAAGRFLDGVEHNGYPIGGMVREVLTA